MQVLEDMLNQKDYTRIGTLRSLDFSDRAASGRLRTVLVTGSDNVRRLKADLFQAVFNKRTPKELGEILSTRFDIQVQYPWIQPVADMELPGGQSRYFKETSHNIIFGFKTFFEQNGGIAAFGMPLTEEFTENGFGPIFSKSEIRIPP